MAIAKLNQRKTIVQFIDDNGYIYFTSINFLMGLLNGKSKSQFVLLKRFPNPIAEGRFKKSEIWDPEGVLAKTVDPKTLTTTNDSFSVKDREEKKEKEVYKDKEISW